MAEWNAFWNEDNEVEEEEGEESGVDYKYTGRDSLVFLVDASREMFVKGESGGPTNFDLTMQCMHSVYSSKIISREQDLVALVFFGTGHSKNLNDAFKNVYVYHDLDSPGAKRVQDLDRLRGEKGAKLAAETLGTGATSLGQALWCCSNLYSDIKLRLSHKRLMIFTCRDGPHGDDGDLDKLARTKAGDLKETGVLIDLLHLKKEGGFDLSLFYCDIMSPSEGEDEMGLRLEPCGKLEDLQKRVRAKEMKKRVQSRLSLSLGDGVKVGVGVYALARTATKPPAIRLYRDSNEPVHTKTRLYHTNTGSLLLPSDTKRSQVYGSRQIVLEKEEVDELKRFGQPGLVLIGFKPTERLKLHQHIRPSLFIFPEEEQVTGSSCLVAALLRRCKERGVFAVCKFTPRHNTPPRFVALVPQAEELDAAQTQITPPGFHVLFLPFADDVRTLDTPQHPTASHAQVEKMKEVVTKLRFKYRSDAFENPALQQHFRNLEALALDLQEPEPIEDFTKPKAELMDERLGPLVQEIKDLIYPADYNPEGKTAAKRKPAEGGGGAEKKPKVELSEAELRSYVSEGKLGKLTVPVLKDACRQFGVRTTGTKKQELIDALTQRLSS